jgi:hypothetical protein
MKITISQLRTIIKEEVSKLISESEKVIVRRGGVLNLRDDEGNETFFDNFAGSDFEHLKNGESEVYRTGGGRASGGSSMYGRFDPSYRGRFGSGSYRKKRY